MFCQPRKLRVKGLKGLSTFVMFVEKVMKPSFTFFKKCNGVRAFAFGCSRGGKTDLWLAANITELMEYCINPP